MAAVVIERTIEAEAFLVECVRAFLYDIERARSVPFAQTRVAVELFEFLADHNYFVKWCAEYPSWQRFAAVTYRKLVIFRHVIPDWEALRVRIFGDWKPDPDEPADVKVPSFYSKDDAAKTNPSVDMPARSIRRSGSARRS
jgi:hypothetical protein